MKDFAAIDFETANREPTSVCSVGIVVVRGGIVTEKLYRLIRPGHLRVLEHPRPRHLLGGHRRGACVSSRLGGACAPHRGTSAGGAQQSV